MALYQIEGLQRKCKICKMKVELKTLKMCPVLSDE